MLITIQGCCMQITTAILSLCVSSSLLYSSHSGHSYVFLPFPLFPPPWPFFYISSSYSLPTLTFFYISSVLSPWSFFIFVCFSSTPVILPYFFLFLSSHPGHSSIFLPLPIFPTRSFFYIYSSFYFLPILVILLYYSPFFLITLVVLQYFSSSSFPSLGVHQYFSSSSVPSLVFLLYFFLFLFSFSHPGNSSVFSPYLSSYQQGPSSTFLPVTLFPPLHSYILYLPFFPPW